jgi:hypothetical protein
MDTFRVIFLPKGSFIQLEKQAKVYILRNIKSSSNSLFQDEVHWVFLFLDEKPTTLKIEYTKQLNDENTKFYSIRNWCDNVVKQENPRRDSALESSGKYVFNGL